MPEEEEYKSSEELLAEARQFLGELADVVAPDEDESQPSDETSVSSDREETTPQQKATSSRLGSESTRMPAPEILLRKPAEIIPVVLDHDLSWKTFYQVVQGTSELATIRMGWIPFEEFALARESGWLREPVLWPPISTGRGWEVRSTTVSVGDEEWQIRLVPPHRKLGKRKVLGIRFKQRYRFSEYSLQVGTPSGVIAETMLESYVGREVVTEKVTIAKAGPWASRRYLLTPTDEVSLAEALLHWHMMLGTATGDGT